MVNGIDIGPRQVRETPDSQCHNQMSAGNRGMCQKWAMLFDFYNMTQLQFPVSDKTYVGVGHILK